jgi:hypothetical protein
MKRRKLELILTGLSADNLDVANDLIRSLKREIGGFKEQLRRKKDLQASKRLTRRPSPRRRPSTSGIRRKSCPRGPPKSGDGSSIQGVKIDAKEGWVEAGFYEQPALHH